MDGNLCVCEINWIRSQSSNIPLYVCNLLKWLFWRKPYFLESKLLCQHFLLALRSFQLFIPMSEKGPELQYYPQLS